MIWKFQKFIFYRGSWFSGPWRGSISKNGHWHVWFWRFAWFFEREDGFTTQFFKNRRGSKKT